MARKRRRKPYIPLIEIPVVEIVSPKINVYGHQPELRLLEDGTWLSGCTCGWRSRNRARKDKGLSPWWSHARSINNGNLIMNAEHESQAS